MKYSLVINLKRRKNLKIVSCQIQECYQMLLFKQLKELDKLYLRNLIALNHILNKITINYILFSLPLLKTDVYYFMNIVSLIKITLHLNG